MADDVESYNLGKDYSEDISKNISDLVICDPLTKCKDWLDNNSIDDDESVCSETTSGSVISEFTNNSAMDSGYSFAENDDIILENRICNYRDKDTSMVQYNQLSLEKKSSKYENINIYKSKKVHIGDVTIIKGPVIVNTIRKQSEQTEDVTPEHPFSLEIISRINWLAQPALGKKEYLKAPAKFVIIGHTATEEGYTQAENTLLVRLIQTFHIESRKWADIAYNFVIGSDGLIYEGRGWGVQGAHTRIYNKFSIGISFIGCFLEHLPPKTSLKKARELINYGVERGYIDPNYILLGHCQCSAVESPGKRLFEEIQTWDHWDESINIKNPAVQNDPTTQLPLISENIP